MAAFSKALAALLHGGAVATSPFFGQTNTYLLQVRQQHVKPTDAPILLLGHNILERFLAQKKAYKNSKNH
jgi:hypothetical protein